MECPPRHTSYDSELLAQNARTLHRLAFPHCPDFRLWPCGDHWHVGHPNPQAGEVCKHDPAHQAAGRRLRKVRNFITDWR